MTYALDCDSCPFEAAADTAETAYTGARDHEADHPTHTVLISETE